MTSTDTAIPFAPAEKSAIECQRLSGINDTGAGWQPGITVLDQVHQSNEGDAAIGTNFNVFPFGLIDNGRHLRELKQAMRFDVTHSLRRSISYNCDVQYGSYRNRKTAAILPVY
jgi:hypothetical protein